MRVTRQSRLFGAAIAPVLMALLALAGPAGDASPALADESPRPADAGAPLAVTPDVTPPERIRFVKPEYPETALKDRQAGKVILEIVLSQSGTVEAAKVIRSNPVFDTAAMTAVVQWRYKPALKAGKPVRVYLTVVIDFSPETQDE